MGKGRPRRTVLSDPLRTELMALKRKNAELEEEAAELLARKERLVENNAELRAALAAAQATGALDAERAARAGLGPDAARAVVTDESHPLLEKYESILASLRNRQSQGRAMARTERAVVELAEALTETAGRWERFVAEWQADGAYMNEVVARYFRFTRRSSPSIWT